MSRLKKVAIKKTAGAPVQVVKFEDDRSGANWVSTYDQTWCITGPESLSEVLTGSYGVTDELKQAVWNYIQQNMNNEEFAKALMSTFDLDEDMVNIDGIQMEDPEDGVMYYFGKLPATEQLKRVNDLQDIIELRLDEGGEDQLVLVDANGQSIK